MNALFLRCAASFEATGWLGWVLASNGFLIWWVFLRLRRRGLDLLLSLPASRDEAGRWLQNPGDRISVEAVDPMLDAYRRQIELLRVLTLVAPLLGLLGTVMGLGISFGASEDRTQVVSGIAQALVSTQMGLTLALPGFFGHARLISLRKQLRIRGQLYQTALAGLAEGVVLSQPVSAS